MKAKTNQFWICVLAALISGLARATHNCPLAISGGLENRTSPKWQEISTIVGRIVPRILGARGVKDPNVYDDVSQEVRLNLWMARIRIDPNLDLTGLIATLAKRRYFDLRRHHSIPVNDTLSLDGMTAPSSKFKDVTEPYQIADVQLSPLEELFVRSWERIGLNLMSRKIRDNRFLPLRRQCLFLIFSRGLSPLEVAEQLSITRAQVGSHVFEGKEQLTKVLLEEMLGSDISLAIAKEYVLELLHKTAMSDDQLQDYVNREEINRLRNALGS